jgi:heme-degrading monooxygenase HmoA
MFAVIFEVQAMPDRFDEYLDLAKQLKPKLEAIEGFIDNERFGSKRTNGRLLSLSTWRDEKAVVRWRTHAEHHGVQKKGRGEVLEDYHLRVGEVTADTHPPRGMAIAQQRLDETEIGDAKVVTLTEVAPKHGATFGDDADALLARLGLETNANGLLDRELFESIYNPGKAVLLLSWRDAGAAAAWKPAPFDAAEAIRHRHVRVIRDYGMFERREAPQFYPPAKRARGHEAA